MCMCKDCPDLNEDQSENNTFSVELRVPMSGTPRCCPEAFNSVAGDLGFGQADATSTAAINPLAVSSILSSSTGRVQQSKYVEETKAPCCKNVPNKVA